MRRRRPTPSPATWRREETWAGARAGDPVEIDDPRLRRGEWIFVAHVVNESSGEHWVEVRGGLTGQGVRRSVRCDTVFPAGSRRRGRLVGPSYLDAPRLPL